LGIPNESANQRIGINPYLMLQLDGVPMRRAELVQVHALIVANDVFVRHEVKKIARHEILPQQTERCLPVTAARGAPGGGMA
jgi:hypothetical protein